MSRLTPVVLNILIINVLIFGVEWLFKIDLAPRFGLHYLGSPDFNPVQFITHMFLHDTRGFAHIFSNMFGLIMFGPLLEQVWGPRRFLFFYLFTGIGAALLYTGVNYYEMGQLQHLIDLYAESPSYQAMKDVLDGKISEEYQAKHAYFLQNFAADPTNATLLKQSVSVVQDWFNFQAAVPMIGASGAIFGVLAAFGLLFPNTELFLLFLPFPLKAKYFVALYGLYELYGGIQRAQGDNVAHFAHIGGMIFAFILIRFWGSQRKKFY